MTNLLRLYEHEDYRGESITVDDDLFSMPAGWDNRISSARVQSPVALFPDSNFGGNALVLLTRDTPRFTNIRGLNFNEKTSSVRFHPLFLRLNFVIGEDRGKLGMDPEAVSEQVEGANETFAQYGIHVEARKIRIAPGLCKPLGADRLAKLMKPYAEPDMVNVLFFGGQWWTPIWWTVKSIRLEATPGWSGTLEAELFDDVGFTGNSTMFTVDPNQPSYPNEFSGLSGDTKSIKLGQGTRVVVFSRNNYGGSQLPLFHHTRDISKMHYVYDWWRNKAGHCCHDAEDLWIRVSSGAGRYVFAHELGHWMGDLKDLTGLGEDTNLMWHSDRGKNGFTFEQAESCWRGILQNNGRKARLADIR